jgi:hypothetical protein
MDIAPSVPGSAAMPGTSTPVIKIENDAVLAMGQASSVASTRMLRGNCAVLAVAHIVATAGFVPLTVMVAPGI